jgi:two-component system, NtrC family, sensor kinase
VSGGSSAASPAQVGRILLAEDDPSAAEMLKILLEHSGYEVDIAATGAAAIERASAEPPPDLVLLDWMLPGVPGVEVCRQLRARYDPLTLPILLVTARSDAESKARGFDAGANDYITKPFVPAELRARIAAHLRLKQLSAERALLLEHLPGRELSTLGLLVSGVAHDLNNPLGGISGFTQLLLEEEGEPEKRAMLRRILDEVDRCNRIVAELVDFARRQAAPRARVNLRELLASTVELRRPALEAGGIQLRVEITPDLPPVIGNEHQLQRVFVNVLVNAEHALRAHGSCLEVLADRLPGSTLHGAERLVIRFRNDGPRIPPAMIERIFDPFITTKNVGEGTGLGLAICRRIVREHGGDIEVESGAGWTEFAIVLGVAPAGENPAPPGGLAAGRT